MRKLIVIFGFIVITFSILLVIIIYPKVNTQGVDSNINNTTSRTKFPEPTISDEVSELAEIINKNFSNTSDFAVVIKNFETNEEIKFNENKKFDSASLYKLWVLGVAMQKIEEGEIDESDSVSGDKNKYDELLAIGPPQNVEENQVDGEEKEFISMNIEDAIEKMITESDNYAALLLADKLGLKAIEEFLDIYKLSNSSYRNLPKTTAGDIANYYDLLYNGEIVNEDISSRMIEILSRQKLNDRIPKYLPNDIVVAHKTGELLGSKHDAGIVYGENGDYMIVVLSKTKNESIAAGKIARFSEDIYNYFENKN